MIIVLYSQRMSSYKDKGPSKIHLILEALAVMVVANLAALREFGED